MPVVLNQLQSIEHLLSPVEKRIAALIKESPLDFATLSGRALAAQAEVSESALVRFSQRIGFSGLREMKLALMRDVHMLEQVQALQSTDSTAMLLHQTFSTLHEALKRTARLLDTTQIEKAAQIIHEARRLLIICREDEQAPALDFSLRLAELGIACDIVLTDERYLKLADYYNVTVIIGERQAGAPLAEHQIILISHQRSAGTYCHLQISYEDIRTRHLLYQAVMDVLYRKFCHLQAQ